MNPFSIEEQHQEFLNLTKIDQAIISPFTIFSNTATQSTLIEFAFYFACGQMLLMMKNDLAALEDDQAIATMEDMVQQVTNYMVKMRKLTNTG